MRNYPRVNYFFNVNNQSIVCKSILHGRVDIYELLLKNGFWYARGEQVPENLSEVLEERLTIINEQYTSKLFPGVVTSVANKAVVMKLQSLNDNYRYYLLSVLLSIYNNPKFRSLLYIFSIKGKQLIVDFESNNLKNLRPTSPSNWKGVTLLSIKGKIKFNNSDN